MVKLPSLNLNMRVTQKNQFHIWFGNLRVSVLSRHCSTTAILAQLLVSINSLSSTIRSREDTFFRRRKESWRRFCYLNGTWVQGKMWAAGCRVLAPAVKMWVSASWVGRIHSRSSLLPLMWPLSDLCLLLRQLAEIHSLFSLAAFFLADVLNIKQAIWLFLQLTVKGVFAAWLLMLYS